MNRSISQYIRLFGHNHTTHPDGVTMRDTRDDNTNTAEWMTPTQAAVRLECSTWDIRRMLIEGKVQAKRVNDQVFVCIDDAIRKEALAEPAEIAKNATDVPTDGDEVLADMLAYTVGKARGACGTSDVTGIVTSLMAIVVLAG
ncbi:MAG: hypothetical protein MI923_29030 [Phycisphaerales bacterium]|nr:hypothetical protein [Phycisphaerales bacterium]